MKRHERHVRHVRHVERFFFVANVALVASWRFSSNTLEARKRGAMRIVIDWDLCQGHANCMGDAPEIFQVDDDGKLTVLLPEPPESLREKAELAVRYCPTGAIRIEG